MRVQTSLATHATTAEMKVMTMAATFFQALCMEFLFIAALSFFFYRKVDSKSLT